MQKNVSSQKLMVFAFDSTTNLPKTGDAANITAYVSIDYGSVTVLGDTSATEMDATNAKGYYLFDLTQGETNGNTLLFSAKSSTSNIVVIGAPAVLQTVPAAFVLAGGASGGLLISGSNAGTTTLGALTITGATTHTGATVHTGAVTMAAGLSISQSTTDANAVTIAANGIGHGVDIQGGNGAFGHGLVISGGSGGTDGYGVLITGQGASPGVFIGGGDTGAGLKMRGGGTSGNAVEITTTSGHGMSITATGTSKHGVVITGGNGGTSDGMKLVAGTGGVDLRAAAVTAAITGNITGNLSGSVGSVTGAVGSVTGAVGSVTGNVGGNVVGTVASVVGAVGSVTGAVGSVTGAVGSVTGAVGSVTGNVGGNVVGSVASVTANVNADVVKISGSTVAADNLEESTESIGYGTCDALGNTTTVIASAITPTSVVNDQYNGRVMIFKNDTTTTALRGQATTIADYVHATLTFTVVALTTAPVAGDTFSIL